MHGCFRKRPKSVSKGLPGPSIEGGLLGPSMEGGLPLTGRDEFQTRDSLASSFCGLGQVT